MQITAYTVADMTMDMHTYNLSQNLFPLDIQDYWYMGLQDGIMCM